MIGKLQFGFTNQYHNVIICKLDATAPWLWRMRLNIVIFLQVLHFPRFSIKHGQGEEHSPELHFSPFRQLFLNHSHASSKLMISYFTKRSNMLKKRTLIENHWYHLCLKLKRF